MFSRVQRNASRRPVLIASGSPLDSASVPRARRECAEAAGRKTRAANRGLPPSVPTAEHGHGGGEPSGLAPRTAKSRIARSEPDTQRQGRVSAATRSAVVGGLGRCGRRRGSRVGAVAWRVSARQAPPRGRLAAPSAIPGQATGTSAWPACRTTRRDEGAASASTRLAGRKGSNTRRNSHETTD